ncbi:IclR family transcriptional regulator [Alkalihalobacillus sp. 1P02AB]|uniref:IclR family transcriptional regulator n=1 Tax=Alkalihalobacillus sp. 1P02AB TaxID=3132260 RepID=UPI0039A76EFB
MKTEKGAQRLLSSVKNAMKILQLYKGRQKELSVTEIANHLSLAKSSAHVLIQSLVTDGFLSQNPRTKKYRLGLSLLSLGGVISSHKELYKEAEPTVKKLVQTLGETAQICLLENNEIVYLFRTECANPVRLLTQIGRNNPAHCTSEGLAILAYQDEKTIGQLLENSLHAYTPYTLTNPRQLRQELLKIVQDGYVIAEETYFEGFVGIAAPIFNHEETVVSSLSVIGSTKRITKQDYPQFINKIKGSANQISKLLGYYH